jgi:hypothetical protein
MMTAGERIQLWLVTLIACAALVLSIANFVMVRKVYTTVTAIEDKIEAIAENETVGDAIDLAGEAILDIQKRLKDLGCPGSGVREILAA